jgi:hypothetical protein
MSGVLDYQKYIELFYTVKNVQEHFPSEQLTVAYDFNGLGADGWTSKISWQTMIVDQISYDPSRNIILSNSSVLGVYPSDSKVEPATAKAQLPRRMYTGPILPDSLTFVPITLVSFTWTKGSDIFSQQLLLVENWETGHAIGDPRMTDDYQPVIDQTSVLTLTSDIPYVYQGDEFPLKATTNIDIPLGPNPFAKFYYVTTGTATVSTFLGTATFIGTTATFSADTTGVPLGFAKYKATFGGRKQYGFVTSNIYQQEILEGVPLDVTLRVSPNPAVPQVLVTTTATAVPRPGYPTTSTNLIDNTVTFIISSIGTNTGELSVPYITTTTFVDAFVQFSTTVTNAWTPTTVVGTNYILNTGTISSGNFNYSATLDKNYKISAKWSSLRQWELASGSTSTTLVVNTTKNYSTALLPVTLSANNAEGTTVTNAWSTEDITLTARVNLGRKYLNIRASDLEFYAAYNPNINSIGFVIPTSPIGVTTSATGLVVMPRKLNANQVLINDYNPELVNRSFKFPQNPYTSGYLDTSTYTIRSISAVPEGALLTLNTNTVFSSYTKVYQLTRNNATGFTATVARIEGYSVSDIADSITLRNYYGTVDNWGYIESSETTNFSSFSSNILYANHGTWGQGSFSLYGRRPDYKAGYNGVKGYNYWRTKEYTHNFRTFSYNTQTEYVNDFYRNDRDLLFTTSSFVDGYISLGNYTAFDNSKPNGYSFNTGWEPAPRNTFSSSIFRPSRSYSTLKSTFYSSSLYNLDLNNGLIDSTLTNVLYFNQRPAVTTGTTFSLNSLLNTTATNNSYAVVGINYANNSLIIDPPWYPHHPSAFDNLNGKTISFTIPSALDQTHFAVAKIIDLKYIGLNQPYFTNAYKFNKIKLDNNANITVGTIFRLAGGTNSPISTIYTVITDIDTEGYWTIDPPYTINTDSGLQVWQKDNVIWNYFMANEANRSISFFGNPTQAEQARILEFLTTNKIRVDQLPAGLTISSTFYLPWQYVDPTAPYANQHTITAIDPIRNTIDFYPIGMAYSNWVGADYYLSTINFFVPAVINPKIISGRNYNVLGLDYIPSNLAVNTIIDSNATQGRGSLPYLKITEINTGTKEITIAITDINNTSVTVDVNFYNTLYNNGFGDLTGNFVRFVNFTPVRGDSTFLGTATQLTTGSNILTWTLPNINLPEGTYNINVNINNKITTGSQAPITFPGPSISSYGLTAITGISPVLTFDIDYSNASYDRVTITCPHSTAKTANDFYVFENPVQFWANTSSFITQAAWSRVGTLLEQQAHYDFSKGTLTSQFYIYWPGSLDHARTTNNQILFDPVTIYPKRNIEVDVSLYLFQYSYQRSELYNYSAPTNSGIVTMIVLGKYSWDYSQVVGTSYFELATTNYTFTATNWTGWTTTSVASVLDSGPPNITKFINNDKIASLSSPYWSTFLALRNRFEGGTDQYGYTFDNGIAPWSVIRSIKLGTQGANNGYVGSFARDGYVGNFANNSECQIRSIFGTGIKSGRTFYIQGEINLYIEPGARVTPVVLNSTNPAGIEFVWYQNTNLAPNLGNPSEYFNVTKTRVTPYTALINISYKKTFTHQANTPDGLSYNWKITGLPTDYQVLINPVEISYTSGYL